jgi:hypothetical protein
MDIQNLIVTMIFLGAMYAAFLEIGKNIRGNTGKKGETLSAKKNCNQNNCQSCRH